MKHLYFQHANKTYSFVYANVDDIPDNLLIEIIRYDLNKRNPEYALPIHINSRDDAGRIILEIGSVTERYVIF